MPLIKELEQFGLDNKKARVYLACLEFGTAKANEIAKKTGLERPTTYDILGKLSNDGLVGFFNKRGVRYYVAEDPTKIKRRLAEKQAALDALLPELKSVYNALTAKPKITYYEGVEGIKTILEDTLTASNKQIRGILSVVDLFRVPGKTFMEKYVAKRISSGVRLYVLRSRPKEVEEYWPTDAKELRELRYTPDAMVFTMTMYIYGNKVSLISSQKENFGIIIESEEFHQNMSHLFEGLWKISSPA
jgi:sugar-specific transcriptional regulator TrmB